MKTNCILAFAVLWTASIVSAATLTNSDIIKMSDAKLDQGVIITAIQSSNGNFDTSADGLIALSSAKVPEAIISELLRKNAAPATKSAATVSNHSPAAEAAADTFSPSEVFLIEGDDTRSMRYINPQVRTAARGLGFGGIASYAVLRGEHASERIKTTNPSFLVSVPVQAQADSYLTLASFAVRKNSSREVLIGGGYMSYSSGIHPDRLVAVTSEKIADQSKAQKGFIIYKVQPKNALPAGEYAVILYTGEMQGLVGPWFTGSGNSYFDFGID